MNPGNNLGVQAQFFHQAFSQWLREPGITIACGRWNDGAISELIPGGAAKLLPAVYEDCFVGVRELRLEGQPHHLHIDFGRVHTFAYTVAPSVCLSFRPSFEVRLLIVGPGGAPTDRWVVSLMLACPYAGERLLHDAALRFFALAQEHAGAHPEWVTLEVAPEVRDTPVGNEILGVMRGLTGLDASAGWEAAIAQIVPPAPRPAAELEPVCLPLLEEALRLPEASLVIYRDRTLVEFKTDYLDGVHRYEEDGHVSWQIGGFHDHHCHLSLGAVTRVLFSAEAVGCQGGRLNYTVWFLTPGPSGNPYRRDGYFSIVLNRPYEDGQARLSAIEPVFALYRAFQGLSWVEADARFLEALEQGPPSHSLTERMTHATA